MTPRSHYARFSPALHFASAKEEILFGGGTYTMRLTDEHEARLIHNRWTTFLLQHEEGLAFEAGQKANFVRIQLSSLGKEAITLLGHMPEEVQLLGMNPAFKARFLTEFEQQIKELS